ncbi:MAG: hypothetical protein RIE06_33155 [Roseibium album]|uniref:Uncharacterized protein n=1 Tax=Roseibium album TaxID=311410 RepID=A0A0M6ZTS9_9HYPH|nr:hypothetical protein [Roseibium album]MBG6143247.1 hypothetical protein [Labrenzia sp. EL_142]MBG6158606.1 hypothetical protein [Labrenzia sp. EL_162]MBG6160391.1 hypothetical protein [Labrenzia sp. EL_195]MBG6175641.1 hypothetical protein [Labrenzia sp. EL_132]MBG6197140.1 hypothetical protein [Labrenzia sp. EL_159]MBG6203917.1 hypothetical protein [Labrenzia sp. EL_13]MBG6206709.1 hypothetical protein [Labrenzia sp. EL_126]MBG6230256.1 hypothetical protein [Labrenzia sp. EL_208]MCR905
MSLHTLVSHLANAAIAVLEFLASPTGGRDLGRGLLERLGLRGSAGRRK